MVISIDGNEANGSRRVGIGQYAYQLLRGLYDLNQDSDHRDTAFRILLKDPPRKDLPMGSRKWEYRVFGPRFLWTQIALPLKLFTQGGQDIIFTPSHYGPRFSPCQRAMSVMDLSFVRFPELFTAKDRYQLDAWTRYSVFKSRLIFTISNFSKSEIIAYYRVPSERIIVTHPGYNRSVYQGPIRSAGKIADVRKKFRIPGKYLIFVGTIQPRKNISRLITAFLQVKKKKDPGLTLVLVGKKGWLWEEIFKHIRDSQASDSIRWCDYVPDSDLALLYQGAEAFVLPSLYEGFGIPVAEAMASGCPVVISRTSSLPEVGGDAAVYVDPYSSESIYRGILRVMEGNRSILRGKGIKQASGFDWKRCAGITFDQLFSLGNCVRTG